MMACTSPALTSRSSPCRISLSATLALRPSIFNISRRSPRGSSRAASARHHHGACRPAPSAEPPGPHPCSAGPFALRRAKRRPPRGASAASIHGKSSSDRTLQAHPEQLLRLHRELHGQLLQHLAREAVHDHRDRVLLRDAALPAVEELVLADLR